MKETALTATRLRVAFVGAGAMARLHLRALRRVRTGYAVVGVYDVTSTAAEEFAARAGARAYPTLGALLAAAPDVVHVCTPAGSHFEPAREALAAGAHIYVEKPFVETCEQAEALLGLAQERGRLVCAGHQLLRQRPFEQLMRRARELRPMVLIDSHFAFRPPLALARAGPRELADQLLDIVPHPLYTLVVALDRLGTAPPVLEARSVTATPAEVHALVRAGDVLGRLFVSLRARPVASTLTVVGEQGTVSADFVRAIVIGAGNEGTEPLEKVCNPLLEGAQLIGRTAVALIRRLFQNGDYPGLAELLGDFYAAAAVSGASPLSADHLRRVTAMYEQLAAGVRESARGGPQVSRGAAFAPSRPVAVVTGARGFLGRRVARALADRGFRVRGISRSAHPDAPSVDEWVCSDLSQEVPPDAFADAAVVVHAAAATAGGFDAHARNTVDATDTLVRAMALAGARRLVHVSSLSVLRPPRSVWERQDEATPLAGRPERLGPYTWGKCAAEALVAAARQSSGLEARIVRPAALIEWEHPELPGLLGRRLFGDWHLGFGRPGLPLATVAVDRAAAAIAWCAARFDEAPPVLNLIDGAIGTRGELLAAFRARGWRGRMIWLPLPLVAALVSGGRTAAALVQGRLPPRLAVWAVLRARRYDTTLAARVLEAAERRSDRALRATALELSTR